MEFADTLPLLHALGWLAALMFAAVRPSLPGGGGSQAGWLIGFCAARLLAAAQDLVGGFDPVARQLAAVVAGMLLWEFARRVWNERAGRRISAATHLVAAETLALVSAVAIAGGSPAWFLTLDLLFAMLPSLLGGAAAWLLWRRFAAEPDRARRAALRLAALGLGIYAVPGSVFGASWDALPPWLAAAGFGAACFSVPATRSRAAIACAAGVALVAIVGSPVVSATQRHPRAAIAAASLSRAERAAAPLQGRIAPLLDAPRLEPAVRGPLRGYVDNLRAADPLLHTATLWQFRADRLRAADLGTGEFVDARPATADEAAGIALARAFVVPADVARGRLFATAWTPVSPGAFETPTAWLALDYPQVFWDVQFRHARQLGIVLVGVLAAFCAMGFVLTVRQQLESAQRLQVERIESANRAKNEFLAFLGHELRTPLQTILGRAELLRTLPASPEPVAQAAGRHAAAIETQGRLLLRLVTDLLDLGTLEAGGFQLRPRPFSLRQVLAAVEDTLRAPAAARQLGLAFEVAPDVPDALIGDEARLRQVLGNLLGNAVKYTVRGSVRLTVARAAGAADSPVARIGFQVLDTGPGLPEDKIPRLFTLFTRLDAGDTFTREGTGVGLALVRRLCESMGGTVHAANRATGGAEFTAELAFPLAPAAPPPATEVAPAPAGGLRVLVVEDNTAAREFLVEALRALGHRPEAAGDGTAALAAARAAIFDAVVLDVNLPGRDGISLARELAALPVRPRLIGCSAEAFAATREAARAAGMDDFLEKPVSVATLAAALAHGAPATAASVFERLQQPAVVARTRELLAAEWPARLAAGRRALERGETDPLRALAHHLQSSALLAGDHALLGLCRRLAAATARDDRGECRATLAQLDQLVGGFAPPR